MNIVSGIGIGLKTYGRALNLIFSNNLWWFFLFPLLLNILLFIGGIAAMASLSDFLKEWFEGLLIIEESESFMAFVFHLLLVAVKWLVPILSYLIYFLLYALIGGYVTLIIMSPVLAYLSERTEKILTGNDYPFDAEQLARDVLRGVMIAIRNAFFQLLFTIGFLLIGIIPIIGWAASIIGIYCVSAYYYGFAFMDYSNERKRLSVAESTAFIKANKGVAVGNGGIFLFTFLIPWIGPILASFTAIVSVVAATLSVHEIAPFQKQQAAAEIPQQ